MIVLVALGNVEIRVRQTQAPAATGVPGFVDPAREPRDAAFWRKWISEGKEGTLMPAFAQAQGGPLTDQQIESLIEFALASLPTQPRKE